MLRKLRQGIEVDILGKGELQTLVDYLMEQLTNFLFFLAWFPVC